jgi:hypothetical protein
VCVERRERERKREKEREREREREIYIYIERERGEKERQTQTNEDKRRQNADKHKTNTDKRVHWQTDRHTQARRLSSSENLVHTQVLIGKGNKTEETWYSLTELDAAPAERIHHVSVDVGY